MKSSICPLVNYSSRRHPRSRRKVPINARRILISRRYNQRERTLDWEIKDRSVEGGGEKKKVTDNLSTATAPPSSRSIRPKITTCTPYRNTSPTGAIRGGAFPWRGINHRFSLSFSPLFPSPKYNALYRPLVLTVSEMESIDLERR